MPKKPTMTEQQQGGIITTLMSMPGVQSVAKLFSEAKLSVELHAPDEETLALLAVEPGKIIQEAKDFTVNGDDEYKLAKQSADSLKNEADLIESKRTNGPDGKGGGTKGLNTLKAVWDSLFSPSKNARESAAAIYHGKMRAYENKKKAEDEAARKEQADQAKQQKQNLENQAAEEDKRAAKLTSPKKKQEALERAGQLRSAAQMIPEQFGETQIMAPSLGSGGKQKRWEGTVTDDQEFTGWLLKNPEWRSQIVQHLQSGLNDLAKAVKKGKEIPGFRTEEKSSYRREAKRPAPVEK